MKAKNLNHTHLGTEFMLDLAQVPEDHIVKISAENNLFPKVNNRVMFSPQTITIHEHGVVVTLAGNYFRLPLNPNWNLI